MLFLFQKGWIVCSLKQIIKGYMEIIGKQDQCGVVCLAGLIFIAADAVLIHVQIHGQL